MQIRSPKHTSHSCKRADLQNLGRRKRTLASLESITTYFAELANMIEPGDVVIGISTSGNSPNVINAMRLAKQTRAATIGLLGAKGGLIKNLVDAYILAQARISSRKRMLI
jgi:phosphoheptose isomerase